MLHQQFRINEPTVDAMTPTPPQSNQFSNFKPSRSTPWSLLLTVELKKGVYIEWSTNLSASTVL
jgi:hypothetical protein